MKKKEEDILFVGKNKDSSNKSNVEKKLKILKFRDKDIKVSISGIIQRNDSLKDKVPAVNGILKNFCESLACILLTMETLDLTST